MKVGKKGGARPAIPAPDQESDRVSIEWEIDHIKRRMKLRQEFRRDHAANAIARVFLAACPEALEGDEARLVGLKRRLFVLDHPEFEYGWGDDGEIVLDDRDEVHFRLEIL